MNHTTQSAHTVLSVYRHRGWYHSRPIRKHLSPRWIGIKFADEVPRDPRAYQGWLKLSRETLDDRLEQIRREFSLPDQDHYTGHGYAITRRQPQNDDCFEIDLDNEVLHIESIPMFRLDDFPCRDRDLWDYIAYDSYGHPACSPSTPEGCRYNWKAPPPYVSQAVIHHYGSPSMEDSIMLIHELLGVSETMLASEATCVNFFQEIVKCGMGLRRVARSIRYLENVPNCNEIPNDLLTLGRTLVGLSCGPFIYSGKDHNHIIPKDEYGYTWLKPQTCLRITTHLDDERNLQAAVADIVKAVMGRPQMPGIVYGIGFSFFHCVIVRINVDDHGSFKHTPALQFLPSFHAQSSSTPGITALVRLGYLSEPLDVLGVPPGELPSTHLLNNMPLELWSQIGHHLFSMDDFIALGSVSPLAWAAANGLFRFPHVGKSRVVGLKSNTSFDKPAEFEILRDGESSDLAVRVGMGALERTQGEKVLEEGKLCFQCEWDGFTCECTDAYNCNEGCPWAMPYLCYDRTDHSDDSSHR